MSTNVSLIDCMGNDEAIVQAARVSVQGINNPSSTRSLIRYLMKNRHTSPFEMCEMKFHIKAPIFIARQWMRHRTANINEISGRYSILADDFYVPEPEHVCEQNKNNKQGRGTMISNPEKVITRIKKNNKRSYKTYKALLKKNVAKEIARVVLPTNIYTEFYWKCDLHNIFHFLQLRLDSHAQLEIRLYAQAIADIVKEKFPLAYEAFNDYCLESISISRPMLNAIKGMLRGEIVERVDVNLSEREWNELQTLLV
jgi:thymidylate synthase (FAD)